MAGPKERPNAARKNTSGAASQKSGTSERGDLSQVISGPDGYSQYHGHHYHHDTEAIDDYESTDDTELTEKDIDETGEGEVVAEIRGGIIDHRDVEAGDNKLEKSRTGKSSRSARDPNLVSWEGSDDPENPKNWPTKRKWAATIVGK